MTRGLIVDERNRAPLYHQLFMILQGKIHDGEYFDGSYLPGEKEIAAEYDVSRITANRALNELAAAGLVVREQGRGTRVRFSVEGRVNRGPADVIAASGDGSARERVRLLDLDYRPAPASVADALAVAPGAEIQYAVRMWLVAGKPYNYLTTFVPADIGRRWTRADMAERPLAFLLRRSGHELGRIDETVTATLADVALAESLETAVGAPLLKIVRTGRDEAGRPVEHLVGFYRPDRYEYTATLDRRDIIRRARG